MLLLLFLFFLGPEPVHDLVFLDESHLSSSKVLDIFPVRAQALYLIQEFPVLPLQLVDLFKIGLPLPVHAVQVDEPSLSKPEPGQHETKKQESEEREFQDIFAVQWRFPCVWIRETSELSIVPR
jgi:hypothetical protein